jgi:hypothetical protein
VPVTDGRGIIQLEVAGAGYDPGSPTSIEHSLMTVTLAFANRLPVGLDGAMPHCEHKLDLDSVTFMCIGVGQGLATIEAI